jgi:acetyltransferase-like isoleucine patch superfamily enzyme
MNVPLWVRAWLRVVQYFDRARLRRLMRRYPGVRIHPEASTNLAAACFDLAPDARLTIEAGVVCERRVDGVRFLIRAGGEIVIGPRSWLRSDLGPVCLHAHENGRIVIGERVILSGCHLSSKAEVRVDGWSGVGPGSRVFDSGSHDLDGDTAQPIEPVWIKAHTWVAADVTVMPGVTIGPHSVVGTRSLVSKSVAEHRLVAGTPAREFGTVGDRSGVPL